MQDELETLFTTEFEPNLNRCVFNYSRGHDRIFIKKKNAAQITGTKSVRAEALSGTKNYYQVQKYFFSASCRTAAWNLEQSKGAFSVYRVNVGPGTKKMQFLPTKRTF